MSVARPVATLRGLLSSPLWLAGGAAGLAGWAVHVMALSQAPLSLVQAFSAGGLAIAVPLGAVLTGTRLRRREGGAIVTMGGALALLSVGAGGAGAATVPAGALAVYLGLATALALAVAAVRATHGRPHVLGLAAGILYGAGDAATKAATMAGTAGLGAGLLSPWTLAVLAATVGAFFCLQRGLQIGSALAVIALMTAATKRRGHPRRRPRLRRAAGLEHLHRDAARRRARSRRARGLALGSRSGPDRAVGRMTPETPADDAAGHERKAVLRAGEAAAGADARRERGRAAQGSESRPRGSASPSAAPTDRPHRTRPDARDAVVGPRRRHRRRRGVPRATARRSRRRRRASAPTWPASAARQNAPEPSVTTTTTPAAAVPASWRTGSPETTKALVSSRQIRPAPTPAGLDASAPALGPQPARRAASTGDHRDEVAEREKRPRAVRDARAHAPHTVAPRWRIRSRHEPRAQARSAHLRRRVRAARGPAAVLRARGATASSPWPTDGRRSTAPRPRTSTSCCSTWGSGRRAPTATRSVASCARRRNIVAIIMLTARDGEGRRGAWASRQGPTTTS